MLRPAREVRVHTREKARERLSCGPLLLAARASKVRPCPFDMVPARKPVLDLYTQDFLGYGEGLLQYNERSSAFRLGFALYR